jgi:uncharacterized phiE125 gp8 family phage protein
VLYTEIITPPTSTPVTLDELKAHLRIVDYSDDDVLLRQLIDSGVEWAERYTRRALITQTRRVTLDAFPSAACNGLLVPQIELSGGKVSSTPAVSYLDTNGTTQSLVGGLIRGRGNDAIATLLPPYGTSWPSTRDVPGAVTVTYDVGYGLSVAVPQEIKRAILLHAAWHYQNRETSLGGSSTVNIAALETLLADYRLFTFA